MVLGQAKGKVDSPNSTHRGKKRALSSATSQESNEEEIMTSSDDLDLDLGPRGEEFLSDFMDRIDVCWDEIVTRLLDSQFWKERENSLNVMETDIHELKEENERLRKRVKFTEGRLTRAEKELDEAKEKIIDLSSRSMRDNIVFKNVAESRGEDVEEKIIKILKEKLKIDNAEEIIIQRAHRVGKASPKYTRKIVACFSSKSKTTVMRHLKHLSKNDDIKIHEQFPPEVHMRRSKLWPQFIQAKQSNVDARFSVDKLIVDNKVVNPPKDKVMDINMDVTSRSLTMKPKHTPVMTNTNNHFQGHTIPVTSADDVVPAIQALCSDQRIAGSSHLVYAYKIGNERSYISNFEDDGEWAGGREIMKVLDSRNCFNHIVAVTRWHGGRMLGPSRFKLIQETAEKAVSLVADVA